MPLVFGFDDLDDLGVAALVAEDPAIHQRTLLEAVDQGAVADTVDTSWALLIAAGIAARREDEAAALAIAARAVQAAEGEFARGGARCRQADLWLTFGHVEQGMRTLRGLRPLLTRDPYAPTGLVDTLVRHGRAELAEQWLSVALATASRNAGRADLDSDLTLGDPHDIADTLAIFRRHVRRDDLRLPPDEADRRADRLVAVRERAIDLRFWPEAAFAELVAAAPGIAGGLDASWDGHRAMVERALQVADDDGEDVVVEVGTPALLAALTAPQPPSVLPVGRLLDWPPGRGDPCWCGSDAPYETCCLPRGRVARPRGPQRRLVCRSARARRR